MSNTVYLVKMTYLCYFKAFNFALTLHRQRLRPQNYEIFRVFQHKTPNISYSNIVKKCYIVKYE